MNIITVLSVFAVTTVITAQNCPPGVPVSMCERDPCLNAICLAEPRARCKVSHCGGCFAHFYTEDDVPVDCDPFHPRIENVHFRTQGDEGIIEGDNMKVIVHHKEV